ncbi:hypothetical protein Hanom_Chr16g01459161 [Helianthus anomalus]
MHQHLHFLVTLKKCTVMFLSIVPKCVKPDNIFEIIKKTYIYTWCNFIYLYNICNIFFFVVCVPTCNIFL